MVLNSGHWWKLSIPFEEDRLKYVGCAIKSVRIIDGEMELAITNGKKLYLHWRDSEGNVIGPQFPEPGKVRCWSEEFMDPFWDELDQFLDTVEELLDAPKDEEIDE